MHHNLLFLKLLKQSHKNNIFLSENEVIFNKSLKTIKNIFTGKDGKNIFTSKPVNWSKNSQLYVKPNNTATND